MLGVAGKSVAQLITKPATVNIMVSRKGRRNCEAVEVLRTALPQPIEFTIIFRGWKGKCRWRVVGWHVEK